MYVAEQPSTEEERKALDEAVYFGCEIIVNGEDFGSPANRCPVCTPPPQCRTWSSVATSRWCSISTVVSGKPSRRNEAVPSGGRPADSAGHSTDPAFPFELGLGQFHLDCAFDEPGAEAEVRKPMADVAGGAPDADEQVLGTDVVVAVVQGGLERVVKYLAAVGGELQQP